MKILYEKTYYVMIGKTKLGYGMNLDFYDLNRQCLNNLCLYENQTVRYKNKWYVVKRKKKYFYNDIDRDEFCDNWIKEPYKKPVRIMQQKLEQMFAEEGKS